MFATILALVSTLFKTPKFAPGAQVNHFAQGCLRRWDGQVVAQEDDMVLVEWPRVGQAYVSARELVLIG